MNLHIVVTRDKAFIGLMTRDPMSADEHEAIRRALPGVNDGPGRLHNLMDWTIDVGHARGWRLHREVRIDLRSLFEALDKSRSSLDVRVDIGLTGPTSTSLGVAHARLPHLLRAARHLPIGGASAGSAVTASFPLGGSPPPQLSPLILSWGWPAWYLALLALLYLVGIAIPGLAARQLRERLPEDAIFQALPWVAIPAWLAWGVLLLVLDVDGLLSQGAPLPRHFLASIAAYVLPSWLWTRILSHRLDATLRTRLGRGVRPFGWRSAAILVLLGASGAAVDLAGPPSWLPSVPWSGGVIAVAALILVTVGTVRIVGPETPVGPGALRDRVSSWADAFGLQVDAVALVPDDRVTARRAVGRATRKLHLPRALTPSLSARELDALIAGELLAMSSAHRTRARIAGLIPILSVAICPSLAYVLGSVGFSVAMLVTQLAAASLVVAAWLETRLDRDTLEHTNDPAALVALIGKQHPGNGLFAMPRAMGRVRAIAASAGIDGDELERPLVKGTGDEPAIDEGPHRDPTVERNAFRQHVSRRISLGSVLVMLGLPIALAHTARSFDALGATVLAWGLVLAAPFVLFSCNRLVAKLAWIGPAAALERRLRHTLRDRGVDLFGAVFAGLAPEPHPRIYDGLYDWDVGFLRLDGDRLRYDGERGSLAIAPDQVTRLFLGSRIPGAGRHPRICVEVLSPAGPRTLVFRIGARLGTGRLRADTFARLEAWRRPGAVGSPVDLPADLLGARGTHPGDQLPPGQLPRILLNFGLFALVLGVLTGLPRNPLTPGSILAVAAVTLLGQLLILSPALRYRDPD
ncbi:MAG: hypothetical protein U0166_28785 [Acidobacteriota bacterium]